MRDLTREQYLERFDDAVRAADVAGARSILQAILALQALEQNAGAQPAELTPTAETEVEPDTPAPNAGQQACIFRTGCRTPMKCWSEGHCLQSPCEAAGLAGAAPGYAHRRST